MNKNIQGDFKICISVPLSKTDICNVLLTTSKSRILKFSFLIAFLNLSRSSIFLKMFGSISQPKHLALNRKDFPPRDMLILLKTGKTESLFSDCRDVQFLLQKYVSHGGEISYC